MRSRLWIIVPLVVMASVLTGGYILLVGSSGRTPSSAVVRQAYGKAVTFDRVYEGEGSSEDKNRVVVVATGDAPAAVLDAIAQRGSWRRIGSGITRSDGLCAVAYDSDEYTTNGQRDAEAVRTATHRNAAVVVSLLYC